MEIQELRERIRRWKAGTLEEEAPKKEEAPKPAARALPDYEPEEDGFEDEVEEVEEAEPVVSSPAPKAAVRASAAPPARASTAPPAKVSAAPAAAQAEPPRATSQPPAQPQPIQLSPEHMAAVQQYGQQLAAQGYSAEQIQAAQQAYIQQILAHLAAHRAAQGGGGGQPQ